MEPMDGPSPEEMLQAYLLGYFPMDEPGAAEVGYYECDPRAVLPSRDLRVPRSVARALRRGEYEVHVDRAFDRVLAGCAADRDDGVWLTPRLMRAYERLHTLGHAHSVEAWRGGELAGGLFGVALRGLFTSESMFHRAPDAGHAALVGAGRLVADHGFALWDIQMASAHTRRFGAEEIPPEEYRARLDVALGASPRPITPGRRDVG